nr:hypothetical protein Iba_chr15bCG10680 [Ipomoea batatas]
MIKQEQEGGEDHSSKNIGIFAGPKKGSVFPKDRELISTKMGKKIGGWANSAVNNFNKKKKKHEDN